MQIVRFVKVYEFQQTQSPIRVLNNPSLIIHFCQQKSSLASKQHLHLKHKVSPLRLQTFLNLSIMQFSLILLPISRQCNEPMPLQIPSLTLRNLFRLSPKFFDVCHLTRSVIRLHLLDLQCIGSCVQSYVKISSRSDGLWNWGCQAGGLNKLIPESPSESQTPQQVSEICQMLLVSTRSEIQNSRMSDGFPGLAEALLLVDVGEDWTAQAVE